MCLAPDRWSLARAHRWQASSAVCLLLLISWGFHPTHGTRAAALHPLGDSRRSAFQCRSFWQTGRLAGLVAPDLPMPPCHRVGARHHSLPEELNHSQDKRSILQVFWRRQGELKDAATLVQVWERLSQRTTKEGPRARHLPRLHEDRGFVCLLETTTRLAHSLRPAQCAVVLASMAKMRYKPLPFARSTHHTDTDAELLSHLLKPLCDPKRQCAWQDAALALSALVSLDCCDGEETFDRLVAVLSDGLTQADEFECLSLALWGLIAARADDVLVDEVTRRTAVVLEFMVEGLADKDELRPRMAKALLRACRRVRTAGLLVGHRRGCGDVEGVWSRLLEGTHVVWTKLQQWVDEPQVSRLQHQVAAALRAAGGNCDVEWDDGKASVDIVLHPGNIGSCVPSLLPIALEVDGPRHFFGNRRRDPTGDTLVKRRALQEGYRDTWQAVISLAHFEWPAEQKDREKLFRRKLCESGVDPLMYLNED